MTAFDVAQKYSAIQYDGTNGEYICGTWIAVTFVSDDGETLTYLDGDNYSHTVPLNYYLVRVSPADNFVTARLSPTDFALKWYVIPE